MKWSNLLNLKITCAELQKKKLLILFIYIAINHVLLTVYQETKTKVFEH